MVKPFSERSVWEILLSTPAAIFYCKLAEEYHCASGSPKGWAAVVAVLAALLIRACIGFWVATNAQESGRPLPYDLASWVFLLPVIALIYVFARHRMRGFVPLGWYLLITLTAVGLAWLPTAIAFVVMNHRTI